jgi:hypothetical protein
MTGKRTLILSSFMLLASTVGGYLVNFFLSSIETIQALPQVLIYAPVASIITNLISSSFVSDAKAEAVFAASREFMLIQLAIFLLLIIAASNFALTRHNPRSLVSIFLSSVFIVPGILTLNASGSAYLHYRLPDVNWASFSARDTALEVVLSVPFFAVLIFAGVVVLADHEQKRDRLSRPSNS